MWDKLTDWIPDTLHGWFEAYFANIDSILELAKAGPSDAITGFPSTTLWEAATDMSNSVGVGIASTLVALFLFYELGQTFVRSDTKGLDGIYFILMAFFKVSVVIMICKNMSIIIGMCFQIASIATSNIANSSLTTELDKTVDMATPIKEAVEKMDGMSRFGPLLFGFVAKIITAAGCIGAELICKLRFVEIYVFTAIAPIPLCTLASREYKNIGVAFIKRLLALGLQGTFIVIVCGLYVAIVNATMASIVENGDTMNMMAACAGYSFLFVIALMQTGGWSKSLLQVN